MTARTLAGVVAGLLLSASLCGLYAVSGWPSADAAVIIAVLLMMPLWIGLIIATYRFRSGPRAWLVLGGATLVCQALLWGLKLSGLARFPA